MKCRKINAGLCVTDGKKEITVRYIEKSKVYYSERMIKNKKSENLYQLPLMDFKRCLNNALQKESLTVFTKIEFKPYSALDLLLR